MCLHAKLDVCEQDFKQEMVFFYYRVTVIFLAHFPGHTFRVTSHRLCLHASLVLHDKYQCPNPAEKTIALEITHRPAHIHKNVSVKKDPENMYIRDISIIS